LTPSYFLNIFLFLLAGVKAGGEKLFKSPKKELKKIALSFITQKYKRYLGNYKAKNG